jgi:hypothetical protein
VWVLALAWAPGTLLAALLVIYLLPLAILERIRRDGAVRHRDTDPSDG